MGNGDGTFEGKRDLDAWVDGSTLVSGDFNGDGNIDLITLHWGWVASIYIGNGDGTFQSKIGLYVGRWPSDIAVPNQGTDLGMGKGSIAILLNVGNHPPVANAGPDQIIECAGPSGTAVTLDGSGSSWNQGSGLLSWCQSDVNDRLTRQAETYLDKLFLALFQYAERYHIFTTQNNPNHGQLGNIGHRDTIPHSLPALNAPGLS